ncbi:MAG: AI-2E family transporter [Firmicutes bacterium]|nr:AI-2E family transporter [Bacillota bacterium]
MKKFFDVRFMQAALLIFMGIAFAAILMNLSGVLGWVAKAIGIITPLLIGGGIAFVLNVPMSFFERKLDKVIKPEKKIYKLKTVFALCITVILAIAIFNFVIIIVAPNILDSAAQAAKAISAMYPTWIEWLSEHGIELGDIGSAMGNKIGGVDFTSYSTLFATGGSKLVAFASETLGSVFGMGANIVLGFVFAIYILFTKKTLGRQASKIVYSYLPKERAEKVVDLGRLTHFTFSKFLSGQCLEAVILGCMFAVVLLIGRFPYALSISVIIGITSLIPILGAFIGMFFGLLLIAIVSIKKAIIFLIIFIVIQQIESNVIYPKVVGGSVGLPAIWTLLAVIVGSEVGGIIGMVTFIPLFSVIYTLLRGNVKKRLKDRDIDLDHQE